MPAPTHIRAGRVRIPLAAIIEAAIEAGIATRESAADNRDADSPGGVVVTAAEVSEDIGVFLATFGQALLPKVLA